MRLPRGYLSEILAHSSEGKPNEVCGLIAGLNGRAKRLYRTANSDPNPRVRYNVEPLDLLRALRDMDGAGWNLMAIYHSHPATEAYPSATDIGLAYYPEAVYIIVSLANEDSPVLNAFRIVDGKVLEEPLEIVEDDAAPGDASGAPDGGHSIGTRLSQAAFAAGDRVTGRIARLRTGRRDPES